MVRGPLCIHDKIVNSDCPNYSRSFACPFQVFIHSSPLVSETPEKYRTIASSRRPPTSASLRDLDMGSQDWWDGVSEIRRVTAGSLSERPPSRASSRMSSVRLGYASGYGKAQSPVSLPSRTPVDTSRDRIRGVELEKTARSTPSSSAGKRRASSAMSYRSSSNFRDDSTTSRQAVPKRKSPVEQELLELSYHTPTTYRSKPISRSQTALGAISSRRISSSSHNTTPTQAKDEQIQVHQTLLLEVSFDIRKYIRFPFL